MNIKSEVCQVTVIIVKSTRNPKAMVVIVVEIMEDSISRWHITQVEVDVEPHYTVHAVVNAASGLRKLRKVPWPSVKRRYEFNGNYRTKHSGQVVVESYEWWVPEACVFDDLVSIKT